MKKIISFILIFVLLFMLASCNENKDVQQSDKTQNASNTTIQDTTGNPKTDEPDTFNSPETNSPESSLADDTTATTVTSDTSRIDETTIIPETTKQSETQRPTPTPTPTPAVHTHSYSSKTTKKAECTADGIKTYVCECGYSYTEKISATGHSWGDWKTTVAPTVSTEGTSQRKCSSCNATEEKKLDKLPKPDVPNAPSVSPVSEAVLQQIEDGFLRLVNEERVRCGVGKLKIDSYLEIVAQTRSVEIIELFSHTRPNGQSFSSLVDRNYYAYKVVGENICITSHVGDGYYTEEDMWKGTPEQIEATYTWIFTLFKNSPGHYANMIDAKYEDCGIGITCVMDEESGLPFFHVAHNFGTLLK